MASVAFAIASILTAAFHGPTWAWIVLAVAAAFAMFAESEA